ncbi:MAG: hypothetical protein QG573_1838, partial [Acidobacteriota bacterium]|nr:hypothetical protein [Acidobacteriota bacterium]
MKLTPLGRFFLFVVGLALAATAFYRFAPADLRDRWLAKAGLSDSRAAEPARSAETPAPPSAVAVEPRLRLAGSNTIGRDLAPAIAEAFLRRQGATTVSRRQ